AWAGGDQGPSRTPARAGTASSRHAVRSAGGWRAACSDPCALCPARRGSASDHFRGTMSEAELYLMRQRLNAGRLSKVQRGEYVQRLPTGLVRLADHPVIKDPAQQI